MIQILFSVQNKINKKCILSWMIVILMVFCVFLMIFWVIKPRYIESSAGFSLSSESVENEDYFLINDENYVSLELVSPIDRIYQFGVYASRENDALKDSSVIIKLKDESNTVLWSNSYNYDLINDFTFLALVTDGISDLKDQKVKLEITTENIDTSNSLKIYKYKDQTDMKVSYGGKSEQSIAYAIIGENPSRSFVWYPLMLLIILLSFSTLHKWDWNIRGNKDE